MIIAGTIIFLLIICGAGMVYSKDISMKDFVNGFFILILLLFIVKKANSHDEPPKPRCSITQNWLAYDFSNRPDRYPFGPIEISSRKKAAIWFESLAFDLGHCIKDRALLSNRDLDSYIQNLKPRISVADEGVEKEALLKLKNQMEEE